MTAKIVLELRVQMKRKGEWVTLNLDNPDSLILTIESDLVAALMEARAWIGGAVNLYPDLDRLAATDSAINAIESALSRAEGEAT